ncbi:MAG TPA: hypothetical protein VJX10_19595 [Pseudonocardiaceae bacterium]|nr:hypothetical protein [Pseudonocardiaceae bacterium]
MPFAQGLFTVAGLPAHPLLVDAVAVLLPLAAVCAVGLAVHRRLRRRFAWPVLTLTGVAVVTVPLAQASGRQLAAYLARPDQALARHEQLGNQLLPYALGFGVSVVFLVVAGQLADRERAAAIRAEHEPGTEDAAARRVPTTWRRISVLASVLVIAMAALTTVNVVRVGLTGAQSVWQGVVR